METIDKGTFGKLGKMLHRNGEAEKAYRNAADSADNKKLMQCFRKRSAERKKFGKSLTIETIAAFQSGGSSKVNMHTQDIPLPENAASMLKRFAQSDRSEVAEYGKFLEAQKLPFEIYHLIRKQKMRIELDLFKIRDISDLK